MTGRIPEALEKYRDALVIDESLVAQDPTSALQRSDLSISYTNLGDILSRMGQLSGALERYRQALAVDQALVAADPKDVRARAYLARTDARIGSVLLKSGNAARSVAYFRRALTMKEELLAADPVNLRNQSDVAAYSAQLGSAYAEMGAMVPIDKQAEGWQQARSWYQRSLDVWAKLRKKGALPPRDDGETPEKASAGMTQCEVALAKLSRAAR